MVNPNRIHRADPKLKEVLLGFLDSASSLCDMMNTTMAAVLNEIMSIQSKRSQRGVPPLYTRDCN